MMMISRFGPSSLRLPLLESSLPEIDGASSRIPTGFRPPAQGCSARATLGKLVENSLNPNGVAARSSPPEMQPRWGWKPLLDQTQGSLADSATAGLNDGIPLG